MPTALITGANRGLGLELTRQYAENGWRVIALCRTDTDDNELRQLANNNDVERHVVDVSRFEQIDALAVSKRHEAIDLLINNAGVFGPKAKADGDLRQSFGHMDYDFWQEILRVNTMAPLKLVETFLENLKAGQQKKVVTLSSSIASIEETETGVLAYRSSKTAVNMVMATLANQLKEVGIIFALLCPGWVNTRMGGAAATITPAQSVSGMRQLIDNMSLQNSGRFHRFDGETIPW